jgi:predicted membrane protein
LKRFAGENIADEGNVIHKLGKRLAYAYLILILIVCIILQLLLIIYLFCSYGNFYIKIAIHIFWFIFGLLIIASFLLAMFSSLLCKLGPDVVKMFTYVIGEQNLKSSSPIILNDTEILNVCINGDGNLGKYLELEDIYNSYENLREYITEIDYIVKEIEYKQNEIISKLNKELDKCKIKDRYSFSCKSEFPDLKEEDCDLLSTNKCTNPLSCYNNELSKKYQNSSCSQINELINEVNHILFSYDFPVNDSTINNNVNKTNNNDQLHKYKLTEVKLMLENYSYILNPFMEKIELNLENGTALDYLDCSFLGRHLRTGFHYLHDSVKHQFARFAVLFFIIGIAMAISIIFTIILVMIMNKLAAFKKPPEPKKEEPKPLETSKTHMSDKDLVQNNLNPLPFDNIRAPPVQEPEVEEKSEPPIEYNFEEPKVEDNFEESKVEDKSEVPFPMNTTTHEENF